MINFDVANNSDWLSAAVLHHFLLVTTGYTNSNQHMLCF